MSATTLVMLVAAALAVAAAVALASPLLLRRARTLPDPAPPRLPLPGAEGAAGDRLHNLLLMRMSHDLRSPLNSVVTLSELLREGNAGPLSIEQARYVDVIRHSAETLLGLVNDILDLAAIEGGRLKLEPEVVDLGALVDVVAQDAAPAARDKGIPVHVRAPARPLYARADRPHLGQLLQRLVEHAIAGTSNGYVEIAAAAGPERDVVRLSVYENAPGLADGDRRALSDDDRAFDDYVAGEGPFARQGPAALPLVIAARLARHMGLRIGVGADDHDDGVSFELTLPLAPAEARPEAAPLEPRPTGPAGPAVPGGSGRVLLIEDDPVERQRAGSLLERAGYAVTLAASGDEGLALMRDGRYDAVILDLVMPGMSGLDVLRAARADDRLAAIPFVVLSALYMTKTERAVLGPNVATVMRKGDVNGASMADAVQRAIAGAAAEARAPGPGHGGTHA
jgi:signal transduction histidine kinase/CheY-like chemotaxis protein